VLLRRLGECISLDHGLVGLVLLLLELLSHARKGLARFAFAVLRLVRQSLRVCSRFLQALKLIRLGRSGQTLLQRFDLALQHLSLALEFRLTARPVVFQGLALARPLLLFQLEHLLVRGDDRELMLECPRGAAGATLRACV
jgi:hypothetical protein